MRILWITNQLFPVVSAAIGEEKSVIGGWTYSAAEEIKKCKEIQLGVASLYLGNEYRNIHIDGVEYYLIPCLGNKMKYHKSFEFYCKKIRDSFSPDIVHIYGTEYPITLAYINACGNSNVIVSMQGVPLLYSRYFFLGISLIDILKRPVMLLEKLSFDRSNKYEQEALKRIMYYEGRSCWDKAVAWTYNQDMKYFHCNRTLRAPFYNNEWNLENIEKYSIFLSQAQYSIKGLHQVLKALPLIIRKYPKVQVYIAGSSPFEKNGLKAKVKSLGYNSYIKSLIVKLGIESHIHFIGLMDAERMVSRYLSSHVFVCPSTIENVPNSLAEAQILGVPSIASYVGGNNTLIEDNVTGILYRFEEYEMLAMYVCDIFGSDELAIKLSKNSRKVALKRHNKENNINTLVNIYNSLLEFKIQR